jgi:hypothetical protein
VEIVGKQNQEGTVVGHWEDKKSVWFVCVKHMLGMENTNKLNRKRDQI